MKKIIYILIILFSCIFSYAQMPMEDNPDFSNWNWEDQSQMNWKMKVNGIWIDLSPPFAPTTERSGYIVDIHTSEDYTKAKGWQLVWAQFNNNGYPYFMIYNPHKSILRVFFYLHERPFTSVLATLKYHGSFNPAILSMGDEYQTAIEDYFNQLTITDDDMLAVVIPTIGVHMWGAVDFPIMYDNYIRHSRYENKKWVFEFMGCENYGIHLKGRASTDSTNIYIQNNQYLIYGNTQQTITNNKFYGEYAKFHKEIQSNEKFLKDMLNSVKSIDTNSTAFLQSFKNAVESLKFVSDIVSSVSSLSSIASAIFGFVKIFSGTFSETESTKPVATTEYIALEGTMDIKMTLKSQTISIPGVQGNFYPSGLAWQPFNCPMGIINLQKTPTIKVTTPYEKQGNTVEYLSFGKKSNLEYYVYNHPYVTNGYLIVVPSNPLLTYYPQKYPGKFKKYKFDDDIVIATQQIDGLELEEIRLALVCKPTGVGDRKYNITDKNLCYRKLTNHNGYYSFDIPTENPVYKALSEKKLIIHRYDEANNSTYFGTKFMPMDRLKGVVIEVPEDTEVKLGVLAKFKSDKYSTPIFFKALYNMNMAVENAALPLLPFTIEQFTFPFSGYENGDTLQGITGEHHDMHVADEVIMRSLRVPLHMDTIEFRGLDGFVASCYSGTGNTIINDTNFNCSYATSTKKVISIVETATKNSANNLGNKASMISLQNVENKKLVLYPNPTSGILNIILPNKEDEIKSIEVYNILGQQKKAQFEKIYNASQNINLMFLQNGVYILRIKTKEQSFTERIIIQK